MSKILSYEKVIRKGYFLKYLAQANKSAIYALINERDKRVYVGSAKYPISEAGRVISDIYSPMRCIYQQMKTDKKRLKFLILEYTKQLKIDKWKWMDYYKTLGYSIYNESIMPIYSIRKFNNVSTRKVEVQIVTKGKRVSFVKEFKTNDEADLYIKDTSIFDMLRIAKRS